MKKYKKKASIYSKSGICVPNMLDRIQITSQLFFFFSLQDLGAVSWSIVILTYQFVLGKQIFFHLTQGSIVCPNALDKIQGHFNWQQLSSLQEYWGMLHHRVMCGVSWLIWNLLLLLFFSLQKIKCLNCPFNEIIPEWYNSKPYDLNLC